MKKIILFGMSEGSKLIYQTLLHDSSYEIVAFTVDADYLDVNEFFGLPVVAFENVQEVYPPQEFDMLVSVLANEINKLRARKYAEAKAKGYTLISYVHPTTISAADVEIGDNCFISEACILRPGAKIGSDCIIMPGAYIGHDTTLEEHCFIASCAVIMGAVTIKSCSVIGPNATIMEKLTIEEECLIGGGSVILHNTKEKEVYRANQATLMPLTSDKLSKFIYGKKK